QEREGAFAEEAGVAGVAVVVPVQAGEPGCAGGPQGEAPFGAEVVVAAVGGGVRGDQDSAAAVEALGVVGEVVEECVDEVEDREHEFRGAEGVEGGDGGGEVAVEGVAGAPRRTVGAAPHALQGGGQFSDGAHGRVAARVHDAFHEVRGGALGEEGCPREGVGVRLVGGEAGAGGGGGGRGGGGVPGGGGRGGGGGGEGGGRERVMRGGWWAVWRRRRVSKSGVRRARSGSPGAGVVSEVTVVRTRSRTWR